MGVLNVWDGSQWRKIAGIKGDQGEPGPEGPEGPEGPMPDDPGNVLGGTASQTNLAAGEFSIAGDGDSVAVGYEAQSSNWSSVSLGAHTRAQGDASTSLGAYANAEGQSSVALGSSAQTFAFGATALGIGTNVSGTRSIAIGDYTNVSGNYATSIGSGVSQNTTHNQGILGGTGATSTNSWIIPGSLTVETKLIVPTPLDDTDAASKKYVDDEIETIELTPGPEGPEGLPGPEGPQGPSGVVNATIPITYNAGTQTVGIQSIPTFTAVRTQSGTATVPSHSFNGNSATGMYAVGQNILGFSAGGTLQAHISASGLAVSTISVAPGAQLNSLAGITGSGAGGLDEAHITSGRIAACTSSVPAFYVNNVAEFDSSARTVFSMRYHGTERGRITVSSTATAYLTSSDYRLKENVVSLDDALSRLSAIPVHRFNFIDNPDETVDGFLAHEVADVVPEAVHGEKDAVDDDGNIIPQGIDQAKLVPVLVGAVQELAARLDAAGI